MRNIDGLIRKISKIVDNHKLSEGRYSRYLWNNPEGIRKMGILTGLTDRLTRRQVYGERVIYRRVTDFFQQ